MACNRVKSWLQDRSALGEEQIMNGSSSSEVDLCGVHSKLDLTLSFHITHIHLAEHFFSLQRSWLLTGPQASSIPLDLETFLLRHYTLLQHPSCFQIHHPLRIISSTHTFRLTTNHLRNGLLQSLRQANRASRRLRQGSDRRCKYLVYLYNSTSMLTAAGRLGQSRQKLQLQLWQIRS